MGHGGMQEYRVWGIFEPIIRYPGARQGRMEIARRAPLV